MIEVRERIDERINRARLELEIRRGARPALVVILGSLLALACAFYVVKNVGKSVYAATETVRFVVDDASGLIEGGRQELRFKGLQAGTIDEVELVDGKAVVTTKLYEEFGEIYRDARATLRPNTVLEDVYIDIVDRGSKRAGELPADEPLLARQTEVSVQAEDVLNALQPDVRTQMATVLRDLGGGLEDRGASLRAAFVNLVPFVELADRLSSQLAERERLTRGLVSDTSALTAELGRRDAELRALVRTAGTTLRTLEQGSSSLDTTLRELPPTMSGIDSSFAALRRVLPEVDGALDELGPVAARLPSSLLSLRRLTATARPAVRSLRTPVRRLVPFATALRPASADLQSAMDALRPQTGAIDHVTKSVRGCAVALQGFFQWTASLLKFDDARGGPPGRGDVTFGLDSSTALADPNTTPMVDSCAPGKPIGGVPGTGGDLKP